MEGASHEGLASQNNAYFCSVQTRTKKSSFEMKREN